MHTDIFRDNMLDNKNDTKKRVKIKSKTHKMKKIYKNQEKGKITVNRRKLK